MTTTNHISTGHKYPAHECSAHWDSVLVCRCHTGKISQWEGISGPLSQVPARECSLGDRAWLLTNGLTEFDDVGLDLVEMGDLRAQYPGAR